MTSTAMPIADPAVHFQTVLADQLGQYMAAADLLGRLHVMQAAKKRTGEEAPMNTLTTFAGTEVLGFKSVAANGAIERIRNLTSYTKQAFDGLAQKYRMQAFTVSGVSDVGLIERIQKELGKTITEGGTRDEFIKAVKKLMSVSGSEELAALQLETVFQTNIMRAYQGGRFEQMKDPAVAEALPYWTYATAGDGRVRSSHAALDGFCARQDDPVWRKIYPPNGYNCRCTVYAVPTASTDADTPGLDRIPAAAADVPDAGFGGLQ